MSSEPPGSQDPAALYPDLILRHHRSPAHRGSLAGATLEVCESNPTCGDAVTLSLNVANGVFVDARFEGEGCAISQASASMMTSLLIGKSLAEADALATRFRQLMEGDPSAAKDPCLGDLRALASVAGFPVRVRCALLGFGALHTALDRLQNGDTLLPPTPFVP